jgi:hypothetical protein
MGDRTINKLLIFFVVGILFFCCNPHCTE